jgi:hypothetical protein
LPDKTNLDKELLLSSVGSKPGQKFPDSTPLAPIASV